MTNKNNNSTPKYKLLNFCEFDDYAIQSYCAIHDVSPSLNLGDITKVDIDKLPCCDLITHGSPCQDMSIAGDQAGADEGSGTRSSLIWNSVEIIKKCNPKFVIWENVKNVLSPKHIGNFNKYIDVMEKMGYVSYYQVLNAVDYGMPQARERIFCISIRKDINIGFEFPEKHRVFSMEEYIDKDAVRKVNKTLLPYFDEKYKKDYVSKSGCIKYFDGENQGFFKSDFTNKRIYSIHGICPTLTTCGSVNLWELKGKMTELEMWRLMGFEDSDYEKAKSTGIPIGALHKQAGNSIVVNVICDLFKKLSQLYPEHMKKDITMISLFSGIGAFEKGLDKAI